MTASTLVDRLLETEETPPQSNDEALSRGWKYYLNRYGQRVDVTPRDTKKAAGRNSVTMSRNRNLRRKAFGYPDYRYSVKDRGWPT